MVSEPSDCTAAAPSLGMSEDTRLGTTGTFRGSTLGAERAGEGPWQEMAAGSVWDNLLTRNKKQQYIPLCL